MSEESEPIRRSGEFGVDTVISPSSSSSPRGPGFEGGGDRSRFICMRAAGREIAVPFRAKIAALISI